MIPPTDLDALANKIAKAIVPNNIAGFSLAGYGYSDEVKRVAAIIRPHLSHEVALTAKWLDAAERLRKAIGEQTDSIRDDQGNDVPPESAMRELLAMRDTAVARIDNFYSGLAPDSPFAIMLDAIRRDLIDDDYVPPAIPLVTSIIDNAMPPIPSDDGGLAGSTGDSCADALDHFKIAAALGGEARDMASVVSELARAEQDNDSARSVNEIQARMISMMAEKLSAANGSPVSTVLDYFHNAARKTPNTAEVGK